MSETPGSFIAAELHGDRYRLIGGSHDTFEKAMESMEQHFRNIHGGRGSFQVFRGQGPNSTTTLIEASSLNGDPMVIRSLYKILEQAAAG